MVKVVHLMMVVVFISLPGIIKEQREKTLERIQCLQTGTLNCYRMDNPTPTAGFTSQFTCLLVHFVVEEKQRKYSIQTVWSYYVVILKKGFIQIFCYFAFVFFL